MAMRKWLNNYFDFTKSELNGLLVLIFLSAVAYAVPHLYQLNSEPETEDEQLIIKKLILNKGDGIGEEPEYDRLDFVARTETKTSRKESSLFSFDPNLIGVSEWKKLGLSEKQGSAIVKYVLKGGKFHKPSDLKKMYTVDEEFYNRVEPYISILKEDVVERHPSKTEVHHKFTLKIVEINTADSVSLLEIKGIGPAFASRILRYRERLGGFYSKEQLKEVYGLDSIKYVEIADQVSVDGSSVKKININKAQIEDFKNHPYIRYKHVNGLIQYRKQHGNYTNIADLKKVLILSPEIISRLEPYLIF
ncbi:MAG: hypothetical protein EOO92_08505 [Pedobacter sp.]|nr:MAG: hypothetical protein EOO92_08505 [Pedobacter sp.]